MKSNYDMFADRGDAWEVDLPARTVSPTGKLRLNRRAHIWALTHRRDLSQPLTPHNRVEENPDLDQYFAGHQIPIGDRLDKERNRAHPTMNLGAKPAAPRPIAATRIAAFRKKQASRKVKV